MTYKRTWVDWAPLDDGRNAVTFRPEFEEVAGVQKRSRFFNVVTAPETSPEARRLTEEAIKEGRFKDLGLVPHAISADGGLVCRGQVGTAVIEVTEIFRPGEHGADIEVHGN